MIFKDKFKVFEVIVMIIRRNHFADLQFTLLVSNCHSIDISCLDQHETSEIQKQNYHDQENNRMILSKILCIMLQRLKECICGRVRYHNQVAFIS